MNLERTFYLNTHNKNKNIKIFILLDNCYTVNTFCNNIFTTRFYEVNERMIIITNYWNRTTNCVCDLKGLDQQVWYHYEYIENVLSYILLKDKYRITSDSLEEDTYILNQTVKENLKFHYFGG